jgi:hypothetical protein
MEDTRDEMKSVKSLIMSIALLSTPLVATAADLSNGADNFYKSAKVTTQKVTFKNQYKMEVAGNLFIPKGSPENTKFPAIVIGHPMGAVKEQSSNLYAQKLAEQGFVTLALDLPFGEKAKASLEMRFCRIFIPRHSTPRSISWARGPLSIVRASVPWGFAAAEALSSVPRKLTHESRPSRR